MSIRLNIKRTAIMSLITLATATMGISATASAHNLEIDPPGEGGAKEGWVGGPLLDHANGKGLIPGGPTGTNLLTPAHDGGLVKACVALQTNGNGVATIIGPTAPHLTPTCRHGSQPLD